MVLSIKENFLLADGFDLRAECKRMRPMIRQYFNRYEKLKREAARYRGRVHIEVLYDSRNRCRCGNPRAGFTVVDTDTGEILCELLLCSSCQFDTSERLFL